MSIPGLPFGAVGARAPGVLALGGTTTATLQVGDLSVICQTRADSQEVLASQTITLTASYPPLPVGYTILAQRVSTATGTRSSSDGTDFKSFAFSAVQMAYAIVTSAQIGQSISELRYLRSFRHSLGRPMQLLSAASNGVNYAGVKNRPLGFLQVQGLSASGGINPSANIALAQNNGVDFSDGAIASTSATAPNFGGTAAAGRFSAVFGDRFSDTNVISFPSAPAGGVWAVSAP
jgi:hypothetical protein